MKSIWNGSITFGLVNIPVKLYSAVKPKEVKMRLLHKDKLSPIRYKKWCDDCDKEVDWKDIVKGVEIQKGKFVILDKKELNSIKPERISAIEILEFIDANQLNNIYINNHYYIGPEREKEKTYFLFKNVLQESAKIAIGKFVMREKEYLCSIASYKEGMLLTTLNYHYELRDIKEIKELKEKPKLTQQEFRLAEQLMNKIYNNDFKIEGFEDTYQGELNKIIKKKLKGEVISVKSKAIPETEEKNLVEALKASLK